MASKEAWDLPRSSSTVRVSVIDTTMRASIPMSHFAGPAIPGLDPVSRSLTSQDGQTSTALRFSPESSLDAHDQSLFNVLEYLPAEANDWKSKGWKEKGQWAFLEDLHEASKVVS
ncbi:hypothetical protein BST61_g6719 [Cercospora zeina]